MLWKHPLSREAPFLRGLHDPAVNAGGAVKGISARGFPDQGLHVS